LQGSDADPQALAFGTGSGLFPSHDRGFYEAAFQAAPPA
jgi:hypothetical protein